jgi:hypothetical protein
MNYEEEYKKTKSALDLIERTYPDDNLNFLINQINVGNITTSNNDNVIKILKTANDGVKKLNQRLRFKLKKEESVNSKSK